MLKTFWKLFYRIFSIGMKPAQSLEWRDVTLVKYSYDEKAKKIKFEIV